MVWVFHNPDPQNGCYFAANVQLIGKKAFSCGQTTFRCKSGQCIPEYQRCDSFRDCDDGSDEQGCHGSCAEDLHRCDDSSCVTGEQCNGVYDCSDYSDEFDCSEGWKLSILSGNLSTGKTLYESDEAGSRSAHHMPCTGLYIRLVGKLEPSLVQVNLTVYETISRNFEPPSSTGCSLSVMSAKREGFRCRGAAFNTICIPAWRKCDGQLHCNDDADEQNCKTTTEPLNCVLSGMIWCALKQMCTPDNAACLKPLSTNHMVPMGCSHMGSVWCAFKKKCITTASACFDTEVITTKCLSSEISCDDGATCYSYHERCDDSYKCSDHADESDCYQETTEDGSGSIFTLTIISIIVLFVVLFAVSFKRLRARILSSSVFYTAPHTTQQIPADHVQLHTFSACTEAHDPIDMEQGSSRVIWNANYAGEIPAFERTVSHAEGMPGPPPDMSSPPPSYEEAVYNQKGSVS